MGELFVNLKRNLQEEREKIIEESIEKIIKINKKHGCSKAETEEDLAEQYALTKEDAAGKVALYW